ncbi:MAG TPA: hypothetical protein VI299_16805 [Polyangiales bacterium]
MALAFVFILSVTRPAAALPSFSFATPDDVEMTEVDVRGRAFLLWYESKDAVHVNDAAKLAVRALLASLPEPARPKLIAVADVSGYDFWPARGLAKRELRSLEKFYGLPIFADWQGHFRDAFALQRDESNLIFVDATGVVRFRAFGKLAGQDLERVKTLVRGAP